MTRTNPRIAIVGAGPAGLVLARVLHRHGIEAVVYERDASPAARAQGGMLDLHPDSGQRALREAGLEAEFLAVARREGQDLRLLDHTGELLLRQDTPDDAPLDRPEVDRADLRAMLLGSLPAHTVAWGRAFRRATALPDGRHRLHFADGGTAECDLLVGADGGNSRVRPLVTDARPAHLGAHSFELGIPDIDRTRPDLAAMVGRGNYWALGPGRALAAQRNGDGRVRVHLTFRGPDDWLATCGIDLDDPARARALLKERFADWDPRFTELIDACDDTVVSRSVTALPIGLTWPHVPGVTLLGDAAHLMPPVGLGANMALLDGAELALAIAASPDDPDAAAHRYETAMFPRAEEAARESARIHALLMGPDAARQLLTVLSPPEPPTAPPTHGALRDAS
ncbi:FAD-dependent oxidoreductase [Streptomyces sp. URMC 123]|uniref:FAD-dependent oxidoreductase n=1 Tax=Streptomyces sp. URMC 123 TaxID=3423403 RepID=UPI003F1BF7E8